MAFSHTSSKSGKEYFLHSKEVTLQGGRQQTIYYFAQKAGPNAINALPKGYKVVDTTRTGLPVLKKA